MTSVNLFAVLRGRKVFRVGFACTVKSVNQAVDGRRNSALAGLERAHDQGYRDPLFARAPAFEPWHDDPRFQALAERMLEFINVERARTGLAPLP